MEIQFRRDLIKLINEFKVPRVVAEIGVAEGLFSCEMLNWGIDRIYCVDNWAHIPDVKGDGNNNAAWHEKNMDQALWRLYDYAERGISVIIMKDLSHKAAKMVRNKHLGLLYLDADHSKEGLMRDLETWFPKVVEGGIVAGHDYLNPAYGVNAAVKEFCDDRFPIHLIPEQKSEDAGFWFQKF